MLASATIRLASAPLVGAKKATLLPGGDRWFESGFLQRGVYCEPVRAGGCRLIAAGGEDAEGSLSDSRSACRRRIALILDIGGRRQADLGVRSLALLASLSLG